MFFRSAFFKEHYTFSLKSRLLFYGLAFLLLSGDTLPAGAFLWQAMGKRHPLRPWLRKVGPAGPIRGLADPVVPANFGNSPLTSSRFQGSRPLDLRVNLPPVYPAPLLERPFIPHLLNYLASKGSGKVTYHFPAISDSRRNAAAGTVPRGDRGMGRRKNIM